MMKSELSSSSKARSNRPRRARGNSNTLHTLRVYSSASDRFVLTPPCSMRLTAHSACLRSSFARRKNRNVLCVVFSAPHTAVARRIFKRKRTFLFCLSATTLRHELPTMQLVHRRSLMSTSLADRRLPPRVCGFTTTTHIPKRFRISLTSFACL